LAAKGTVGGFGVSSEIAWEVFSGVGYRLPIAAPPFWAIGTSHEEYSRDHFEFNLDSHGFLLALASIFEHEPERTHVKAG